MTSPRHSKVCAFVCCPGRQKRGNATEHAKQPSVVTCNPKYQQFMTCPLQSNMSSEIMTRGKCRSITTTYEYENRNSILRQSMQHEIATEHLTEQCRQERSDRIHRQIEVLLVSSNSRMAIFITKCIASVNTAADFACQERKRRRE